MFFTQKDAEAAAKAIGLDFSAEKFTVDDLLAGMNAELRHGTKAGSANVTNDDPTMTAKLAVSNLRVSPVLLFPARGEKRLGAFPCEGSAAQRCAD